MTVAGDGGGRSNTEGPVAAQGPSMGTVESERTDSATEAESGAGTLKCRYKTWTESSMVSKFSTFWPMYVFDHPNSKFSTLLIQIKPKRTRAQDRSGVHLSRVIIKFKKKFKRTNLKAWKEKEDEGFEN